MTRRPTTTACRRRPRLGISTRAAAAQALYDAGIGFFPLRGNHEGSATAALEVQNYFPADPGRGPTRSAPPTSAALHSGATSGLSGLSYAFDYNNARFVLLDQFDHDGRHEHPTARPTTRTTTPSPTSRAGSSSDPGRQARRRARLRVQPQAALRRQPHRHAVPQSHQQRRQAECLHRQPGRQQRGLPLHRSRPHAQPLARDQSGWRLAGAPGHLRLRQLQVLHAGGAGQSRHRPTGIGYPTPA